MRSPVRLLPLCLALTALGGCDPQPPPPPPPTPELKLAFSSPDPSYCASQPVVLTLTVEGGTPERVELQRPDGQVIAPLAPPYQYVFDCGTQEERGHEFVARATVGFRSFSSPTKRVVVDRRAPSVSLSVYGYRDGFPRDAPIEILFSEPMRKDTLRSDSVSLEGFSTVTLSWSENQTRLLVKPSEPFRTPWTARLTLRKEGFQDLAGNRLEVSSDPVQWTWEVPSFLPTWTLPKHGNGVDNRVALAVDRDGRHIAAWNEYVSSKGTMDLYVYRSGPDGGTPLGEALSGLPGKTWVEEFAVDVDASNRPVVAWLEAASTFEEDDRIFVRRWNGTAWEALGDVPNPLPGMDPQELALAADFSDRPVVAWTQRSGSTYLLSVYRWSGSVWEPLSTGLDVYPGNHTFANHPSLAIDGEDRPVIAFSEEPSPTEAPRPHVMRWNGSAWSLVGGVPPRPTGSTASSESNRVSLALDAQGRPSVAFEYALGGPSIRFGIYTARHDGSAWSVSGPLGFTEDATWPSAYVDAAGVLWTAWQEESQTYPNPRFVVLTRSAGGEPRSAQRLNTGSPVLAGHAGAPPVMLAAERLDDVPVLMVRQ